MLQNSSGMSLRDGQMGCLPSGSRRHLTDVASMPDGWRRDGGGPRTFGTQVEAQQRARELNAKEKGVYSNGK